MIMSQGRAMQALHSFGMALEPIVKIKLPTETTTPTTTTSTPSTSGPILGTTVGASGTVNVPSADPQSAAEVHKRGGVAVTDSWSMPTDLPWGTVIDPDFYYAKYPDMQTLVGQSYGTHPRWLMYWHFTQSGIKEGRCGSPTWCATEYLQRYPDLVAAFGPTNYAKAVEHYLNTGIKEGRIGKLPTASVAGSGTQPNVPVANGNGTEFVAGVTDCPSGMMDPSTGECMQPYIQDHKVVFPPGYTDTSTAQSGITKNLPLIGAAIAALFFLRR